MASKAPTNSQANPSTVDDGPTAALAPLNPGVLVAATKAGAAMKEYLEQLQEMLETPYASPSDLAKLGTLFTVHRTTEQAATVDEETGEVVDKYLYLCSLQMPAVYENSQGDPKHFATGERVLISFTKNEIRRRIHEQFVSVFDTYKEAIPNVQCAFVPLSAKARAKGWSRSVTLKISV